MIKKEGDEEGMQQGVQQGIKQGMIAVPGRWFRRPWQKIQGSRWCPETWKTLFCQQRNNVPLLSNDTKLLDY